MEIGEFLAEIQKRCTAQFQERGRIKTYEEFLRDFAAQPHLYLRTSARYMVDALEFFGSDEKDLIGRKGRRWKIFDLDYDREMGSLVGQERVQNAVYNQLVQYARRGHGDKMIVLHGPNGSSKSTIVEALFRGMQYYSNQPGGALFRFNWIFTEREDRRNDRIGFDSAFENGVLPDSYALLKPQEISVCIRCELKDSPLFLLPREERVRFIESAMKEYGSSHPLPELNYHYFLNGDLCPKCKKIFEALLTSYHGSWKDVIRHVQVERYFISKRYRQGAISIEPQANIDAEARPESYEPSVQLPAILQNLGLQEALGDLVDANHGMLEYSDFLKRPLETNKYLLTTSEKGTIHLGGYSAHLDLTLFATTNEKQLSLFKRNPDFPSFKGRMELIPVPYLLMYSKEAILYQRHIDLYSRGRHVTPHTAVMAALWAVLTRLRRPLARNYSPDLAPIVARLTPLEKAKLYDHGETPLHFREEEQKLLRTNIFTIREELNDAEGEFEGLYGAEYEGRRGSSAREMMSVLAAAAENRNYKCLTPMAVFEELENLTKDASLYEFLRVPVDNGYNDCVRFVEDIKQEYREVVKQDAYESIGLVEEQEYERIFEEYFHHVKAYDLGEKLFVPARGQYVDPSEELMGRIEGLLNITETIAMFRSNLMTKIAAYSIDHPDEAINYRTLFPRIYNLLKQSFYRERDRTLTIVEQNILKYGTGEYRFLSDSDRKQVEVTLARMEENHGYCKDCAKDVIGYVLRNR
ncbi:MAG: hypothetical protein L0Z55_10575 [Planctomycetes bacterium]|nr:hypothetical protein [Planctomycetota bacterium]